MKDNLSPAESHNAVLLITDNLKIGGVQKVVVRLARELIDRGYRVGVAAAEEGELWADLPTNCARHYLPRNVGIVSQFKVGHRLRKVINEHHYRIIHGHQRGITLIARVAVIGLDRPVVEHVHNVFLPPSMKLLSFKGKYLIACGSAVADMLTEFYKRPKANVYRILNGVPDLTCSHSYIKLGPSVEPTKLLKIIGVGRTSEQKDPLKFIEVISCLTNNGHKLEAEWVGDGELLDQCRSEVARRGLSNLTFTGANSNVPEKLASADVLLLTSRWEGLPLVALEAMSVGTGAVLPNVGSCRDAVANGENGLLYPADADAACIAKAMEPFLSLEELQLWGNAGRGKYLEGFTLGRMVDEVEAVYKIAAKELTNK